MWMITSTDREDACDTAGLSTTLDSATRGAVRVVTGARVKSFGCKGVRLVEGLGSAVRWDVGGRTWRAGCRGMSMLAEREETRQQLIAKV